MIACYAINKKNAFTTKHTCPHPTPGLDSKGYTCHNYFQFWVRLIFVRNILGSTCQSPRSRETMPWPPVPHLKWQTQTPKSPSTSHLVRIGPTPHQMNDQTLKHIELWVKLRRHFRQVEEGSRGFEIRCVFLHRDGRVAERKLLQVHVAITPGRGVVVVAVECVRRGAVVHLMGGWVGGWVGRLLDG